MKKVKNRQLFNTYTGKEKIELFNRYYGKIYLEPISGDSILIFSEYDRNKFYKSMVSSRSPEDSDGGGCSCFIGYCAGL